MEMQTRRPGARLRRTDGMERARPAAPAAPRLSRVFWSFQRPARLSLGALSLGSLRSQPYLCIRDDVPVSEGTWRSVCACAGE